MFLFSIFNCSVSFVPFYSLFLRTENANFHGENFPEHVVFALFQCVPFIQKLDEPTKWRNQSNHHLSRRQSKMEREAEPESRKHE